MTIALQMQQGMHCQVSEVRFQCLTLLEGLSGDHWRAQHEVTLKAAMPLAIGKREHIGCVVAAAVHTVEPSCLGRADNPHRDLALFPERRARPQAKAREGRNPDPVRANLEIQRKPLAVAAT